MPGIITISGWGQPHDALSALFPEARPVDFARHSSVSAALLDIAAHAPEPDMVIGWSLGGQLLVRAIAAGMLKPRKLVLIATPFQFVKTAELPMGMPRDLFDKFRDNYRRNPEQTLTKAWELICKDDTNAKEISAHLALHDKKALLAKDWLRWLELLEAFSCKDLHMADFPSTLLIHGDRDLVVYPEQSLHFAQAIPHAKLFTIEGCGHAPHWHDADKVREAIQGML
jgi:pimeloyl-ACP methyl ester carboxylesterase